jgi:hypothetical protein
MPTVLSNKADRVAGDANHTASLALQLCVT